jgi:alkaline phosphatase D
MSWPRRLFLLNAARLVGASTAASSSLLLAKPSNAAGYPFSLGVASGSPLPDAVVLWTRVAPDPLDAARTPPLALTLRWEVAHDGAFRNIAARGSVIATPALAHSVRVDVKGLQPARWYWYRFMLGDAVSPVGRTRTAPAADSLPDSLKLAVASCQHWDFGSYAAHRYIEQANPDLIAFLGDYIYEWGAYPPAASTARRPPGRVVHAGRLPPPLRPVQDGPGPAGRAPHRAVDRHVGRPRGRERLRRRPRRAPVAEFLAAARGRLPGLL